MLKGLKIPPTLKELELQQNNSNSFQELAPIDILSLTPAERNRFFSQISTQNGRVPESLQKSVENWNNLLNPKENEKSSSKNNFNNILPRSHLIDTFFSHQLPGIQDSILTDIRRLIKIQNQILRSADHGIKQTKLAIYHLDQLIPENKLLSIYNTDFKSIEALNNLLEDEEQIKPIQMPSKLNAPSIALILESTDGITADVSNGLLIQNQILE